MRIAICDDNLEDIKALKKFISESEFCPSESDFHEFLSGKDLLDNFSKFDIIFLDIKLGDLEGIQVAETIRLHDSKVPISFYTGYEVLASQVAKVRLFSYLIKGDKELKSLVDNTLRELRKEEELPKLLVEYNGKIFVLQLSDILYISILNKGSAIYLTDESAYEILGVDKKNRKPQDNIIKSGVKLETYYEKISKCGFIYAKKSYIVNARYIIARFKDSILLKGHYELTVARSKKKEFDSQLIEYWGNDIIRREQ
ncbi:MAG: LytTR family DNA-binding domain-containing protein [Hungatella sp.]|jgi:DNA-binding LytR/AlgR family response regulator|nr:LytTR family DNA-binding domain-containing protein [Hungatella sp.]